MYVTEILAGRCFEEIDTGALDDLYFSGMCRHLGYDPERILATTPQRGSERILEFPIPSGPYGDHYGERDGLTLDDFKADAHASLVGEAESSVTVSTGSGNADRAQAYLLD